MDQSYDEWQECAPIVLVFSNFMSVLPNFCEENKVDVSNGCFHLKCTKETQHAFEHTPNLGNVGKARKNAVAAFNVINERKIGGFLELKRKGENIEMPQDKQ